MDISKIWHDLLQDVLSQGDRIIDDTGNYTEITMRSFNVSCFDLNRVSKWISSERNKEMEKVFLGGGPSAFGHSYHEIISKSGQLDRAIARLREKSSSKKAVIALGSLPDKEWVPCINTLHFWIRDNQLCLNYYSRGQDLWAKFIPDLLAMRKIQEQVATALHMGKALGPINGMVASLHVYDQDMSEANKMLADYDG